MYGYIYLTTNLVNGKIYVGQKKSKTFLGNKYLGSGKLLNNAILKYGESQFLVEQIEECSNKDELNEREIYWISEFNATDRTIGYNISYGGNGGDNTSNYIWCNNEEVEKLVPSINDILQGFIRGRISSEFFSRASKNKIWINDGVTQKVIYPEDLGLYPNFVLGMLDRGEIWKNNISKSTKNKSQHTRQKISEAKKQFFKNNPNFRNNGNFKRGFSPVNKGRISITDDVTNKYIQQEELNTFLELGWRRGSTQHRKRRQDVREVD